jgi:hypothetical protein
MQEENALSDKDENGELLNTYFYIIKELSAFNVEELDKSNSEEKIKVIIN